MSWKYEYKHRTAADTVDVVLPIEIRSELAPQVQTAILNLEQLLGFRLFYHIPCMLFDGCNYGNEDTSQVTAEVRKKDGGATGNHMVYLRYDVPAAEYERVLERCKTRPCT